MKKDGKKGCRHPVLLLNNRDLAQFLVAQYKIKIVKAVIIYHVN